jgi:hypothetical protein
MIADVLQGKVDIVENTGIVAHLADQLVSDLIGIAIQKTNPRDLGFFGDLVKAERTAAICDESYLEITDVLAAPSDRPAKVRWTMMTEGEPEITPDGIILKKNGVTMLLKTTGAEVTYMIWPNDPKEYDSPLKDIDAYFKDIHICGYEVIVPAAEEITAVTTLEEIKR